MLKLSESVKREEEERLQKEEERRQKLEALSMIERLQKQIAMMEKGNK